MSEETKILTADDLASELGMFYSRKDRNGKGSGYGLRVIKLFLFQYTAQLQQERDANVNAVALLKAVDSILNDSGYEIHPHSLIAEKIRKHLTPQS